MTDQRRRLVSRSARRRLRAKPQASARGGLMALLAGDHGARGRALLLGHLLVSPLVISLAVPEVFDHPRLALLLLTAIGVSAIAVNALLDGLASPGGERWGARVIAWIRRTLRDPLGAGVLLFLLSAIVSTLGSISPRTSILGTRDSNTGLVTIAGYTVVFFATRWLYARPEHWRRLVLPPVVAGAVSAAYTVVQTLHLDPITFEMLPAQFARPSGTHGNPNYLGTFLVMVIPLAAYCTLRATSHRHRFTTGVFGMATLLASVALILSHTRAAWMALVPALLVLAALWWWAGARRGAGLMLAVPVLAGLVVLGAGLSFRGGHEVIDALRLRMVIVTADDYRPKLWRAGVDIFRTAPLLGTGPETYHYGYDRVKTVDQWEHEWNPTTGRAHNEVVHVLATQGLLGILALAVIGLGLLVSTVRGWRQLAIVDRPLLAAVVAALVAFAGQAALSFTVIGCGTLVVTLMALLAAMGRSPAPAVVRDESHWWVVSAVVGAVVLLAVAALSNLAYVRAPESAALVACLGLLLFLVVMSGSALIADRVERRARGDATVTARREDSPAPSRVAGRVVVTVAIWLVAVGVAAVGVVRPYLAMAAIKTGLTAGELWAAIDHFERAVALDPSRDSHWLVLGAAYERLAQLSGGNERRSALHYAEEAVRQGIRLVPVDAHHHASLGRVLAEDATPADRPKVYAAFEEALRLNPTSLYFYVAAASAAMTMDDHPRARQYATAGATLFPRIGLGWAQLGQVAFREDRLAEAEALLRRSLRAKWPKDSDHLRVNAAADLVETLIRLKRPEQALALARQTAEGTPDQPVAGALVARTLETLGRRGEAIEEYRQFLRRHPGYGPAQQALRRLGR